jgi:hypothetical protein
LQQTAAQCKGMIEKFLAENGKFQHTLGSDLSEKIAERDWWRSNLHKVQWALFKRGAVEKSRAELVGQTLAINTLIVTIQL